MNRSRWLTAGLAMLAAATAPGQVSLPPETNLFSGEPHRADSSTGQFGSQTETAATADSQMLVFQDRRRIHGELVEVNGEEIVWRRHDASAPLHFPRGDVRRIVMSPDAQRTDNAFPSAFFPAPTPPRRESASPGTPIPATMKLLGGDWLFGNVKSADGQSFALQFENGPALTIPRAVIEWLHFDPAPVPAFGFAGAALDMEGWLPSSAAVAVTDGTTTVKGASWIGRTIAPPKRFEIAFTLPAESEEGTHLWLQPFTPHPNSYGVGTVDLGFGRKQISHLLFANKFDRQISPLPSEAAEEKGPAHYRVFYDGDAGRVVVRRNGRELGDWEMNLPDNPQPNLNNRHSIRGFCFERNNGGGLQLREVRFRPWNGVLPKGADAADGRDYLCLDGVPAIDGTLQSIAADALLFSGASQTRQAGVDVFLAGTPASSSFAGEVKLQFGEQGEFNARQLVLRDGKVHCETVFTHALEIPAAALQTILFAQQPLPPAPAADVLVFKNGDELQGHVLSATAGGPLHWQAATGQELEFQPQHIAGVRLAADPDAQAPATATAAIELRNGDRLRGQILALDDRQLRLQHGPLGTVTLDRSALWHLYPNPHVHVFDGGAAADEWMRGASSNRSGASRPKDSSGASWIHLDGTYIPRSDVSTGTFNTNEMPALEREIDSSLERFEVRFEIASNTSRPGYFLFRLISKDQGPALAATISGSLFLSIYNARQRHQPARRNIPLLNKVPGGNSHYAVRLFVDTIAGTCDFFINGALLAHTGRDPAERLAKADYTVHLVPYPMGGLPNVLSDVWIGPWSGETLQSAATAGAATALVNGDVAPGAPQEIREGKWAFESELGHLEVSGEKVLAVDFGGTMLPEHTAARLRLVDGTSLNVDGFQWQGRELTAHSATLGDLRLPVAVIAELIYDPAPPHPPMTPEPETLAQKSPLKPDATPDEGK